MTKKTDTAKQPGITINNILLAESTFKRLPQVPDKIDVHFSFSINNNVYNDGKNLVTEVSVELNTANDPVYGKFVFVGLFSVDENENMPLEAFAECNAPAYIIPYIREEVHSRSMKAGLPQIFLPPLNIQASIKESLK
jgi:preprotein translocase subunit SecB